MGTSSSTEDESSKMFSDQESQAQMSRVVTQVMLTSGPAGTRPWQAGKAALSEASSSCQPPQLFPRRLRASAARSSSCLREDRHLGFYIKSPKFCNLGTTSNEKQTLRTPNEAELPALSGRAVSRIRCASSEPTQFKSCPIVGEAASLTRKLLP